MKTDKVCINADTLAHAARPAVYGGPRTPRCATCQRAENKRKKQKAKETRVQTTYGITPEEYDALYEAQGRRCAICQISTGATRRLAVDHDHGHCALCATGKACREGVRGLACKTCNHFLLGRYGVAALLRAARYLIDPPAHKVLKRDDG